MSSRIPDPSIQKTSDNLNSTDTSVLERANHTCVELINYSEIKKKNNSTQEENH